MKIYSWENPNNQLPEENVYLWEDWASAQYFSERRQDDDRSLEEYDCKVHWGTYKRLKFERKYSLYYYECKNVEEFLRDNPETEVLFTRGNFFVKTWMD